MNPARALLVVLAALLVPVLLVGCRSTTEAERVASAGETYEWLVDAAEDELRLVDEHLAGVADGPDKAQLLEELAAARRLAEELRAEIARAVAAGESGGLSKLEAPVLVLARTASELYARSHALE